MFILLAHRMISCTVGHPLLPRELAGTAAHREPCVFCGRWKRAARAHGSREGAALISREAGGSCTASAGGGWLSPLQACAWPQRLRAGPSVPVRVCSSSGGPAQARVRQLARLLSLSLSLLRPHLREQPPPVWA